MAESTRPYPPPYEAANRGRIMAEVGTSGYRGEGFPIAEVFGVDAATEEERHEALATQRLFTAAPDLLAACRAALPHLRALCAPNVGPDDHYGDRKAYNAVLAAVAKADGRGLGQQLRDSIEHERAKRTEHFVGNELTNRPSATAADTGARA